MHVALLSLQYKNVDASESDEDIEPMDEGMDFGGEAGRTWTGAVLKGVVFKLWLEDASC